ncbi:MAG: hypothetical protein DMF80_06135 [Acidobacteria bacterium]|nr:MAG: hypothetical protein DMF80_06135 [Acidobacteriota bacterium]
MTPLVRGAAALAALLLLPGLLGVRAPWTAVPFLSLSFWIASWWWLPFAGRTRLLAGCLVVFALAAGLRLLRPDARRPSWPALVVLAAAASRAGAGFLPAFARAERLDPTSALLMAWHDGLPATYVPLREGSFAAHAHGFDALAADLSLLSGSSVPTAAAVAAAVARALSSIGLYLFLARLFAAGPAALGVAAATLAAALLPPTWAAGDPAWSLALGFLLAAAGLLARGASRAAAVAAGAFVGAAATTAPGLAALCLAAGLLLGMFTQGGAMRGRVTLAAATALLTAGPFLLQAALAFVREGRFR